MSETTPFGDELHALYRCHDLDEAQRCVASFPTLLSEEASDALFVRRTNADWNPEGDETAERWDYAAHLLNLVRQLNGDWDEAPEYVPLPDDPDALRDEFDNAPDDAHRGRAAFLLGLALARREDREAGAWFDRACRALSEKRQPTWRARARINRAAQRYRCLGEEMSGKAVIELFEETKAAVDGIMLSDTATTADRRRAFINLAVITGVRDGAETRLLEVDGSLALEEPPRRGVSMPLYTSARARDPRHMEVAFLLDALRWSQSLTDSKDMADYAHAANLLGLVYEELGENEAAARAYLRAVEPLMATAGLLDLPSALASCERALRRPAANLFRLRLTTEPYGMAFLESCSALALRQLRRLQTPDTTGEAARDAGAVRDYLEALEAYRWVCTNEHRGRARPRVMQRPDSAELIPDPEIRAAVERIALIPGIEELVAAAAGQPLTGEAAKRRVDLIRAEARVPWVTGSPADRLRTFDLMATLEDDVAAVWLTSTDKGVAGMVVTRYGQQPAIQPFVAPPREAAALRACWPPPSDRPSHEISSALDRLGALTGALAKTVAQMLRRFEIRRVRLMLRGALRHVPLHCSPWDEGGNRRCLVDEFDVSYCPMAPTGGASETTSKEALETAAFAPRYDRDIRLPGARLEAGHVAEATKGTPYVGEAGTAEALVAALRSRRSVHVAAHYVETPDSPLSSRLDMYGSPVRVHDLLVEPDAGKLDLVFLSACGTARASSREPGVPSLAETFAVRGARWVIATLWEVDDIASTLMCARIYAELDTHSPPSALAAAQRWLSSATHRDLSEQARAWGLDALCRDLPRRATMPEWRPYETPRFWAAFIVLER